MQKSKVTSKGRQIIKPRKILTTSSDENIKKRRKIIKTKPVHINKALDDLTLTAAKLIHPIFKQTNYKEVHNSNVKENASTKQSYVNETRSSLVHSISDLSSNTMMHEDINRSVLEEIAHTSNHSNRLHTANCSNNCVIATNNLKSIDRPVFSSDYKKHTITQDQRLITDHSLQQSEKESPRDTSSNRSLADSEEKNILFQNNVIQLLNKIVEQNTNILAHIKSLKLISKMETIKENLYNRPDGLSLTTVEEFKSFESDIDRLRILKQYLKFIGGIKLREALHHFQKETMTDELTAQFTYWGRTTNSIPFHNTKIAKIFFLAAKDCQTFEGPRNVAEFKSEIMEVLRTAKQRYTIKTDLNRTAKDKHVPKRTNTLEDNEDNGCETDNSTNYEACDLLFSDDSDEND